MFLSAFFLRFLAFFNFFLFILNKILINLDPAFVAKNLSNSPFEDQTKQMLTLRENVRSMLNDHRRFQEIHKLLLNCENHLSVKIFFIKKFLIF